MQLKSSDPQKDQNLVSPDIPSRMRRKCLTLRQLPDLQAAPMSHCCRHRLDTWQKKSPFGKLAIFAGWHAISDSSFPRRLECMSATVMASCIVDICRRNSAMNGASCQWLAYFLCGVGQSARAVKVDWCLVREWFVSTPHASAILFSMRLQYSSGYVVCAKSVLEQTILWKWLQDLLYQTFGPHLHSDTTLLLAILDGICALLISRKKRLSQGISGPTRNSCTKNCSRSQSKSF